ncbi:LOW QUALITY PROTEIN: uncharacterized protein LOC108116549 [Drosophila eugracilis]|uniref:LOW QUALITY PROTEIN: uncharacterized protein LOC108116549 n=1 Tax=Drosophila eugracilis TaxID=29029 RepID=UPI001BDABF49|nr:LOW QUALITY PROTEIN: uncharacterized protein LOC108116549 [Drosophila eugracilis]
MSTRKKWSYIASKKENSPIGNCWLKILMFLLVANLANALKAGESIQLATGSPSLNINNADSSLEQLIEMRLNESQSSSVQNSQSQELLSRKRRYLVFPEGSSFQMVYDEIVGVVDHTNYLILGITVALAWELPSKPPSEELDDLLTKLEDGTIDISRNDTVSNITYVDDASEPTTTKPPDYKPNYINLSSYGSSSGSNSYYSSSPVFRFPMHPSHQYADSYYSRPKGGRRKDNHYYYNHPGVSSNNPFSRWTRPSTSAHKSRYPYWALNSRIKDRYYGYKSQQSAPPPAQRRQDSSTTTTTTNRPTRRPAPRHHRIYPVFGKRSIPDAANPHKRQRRSGVATEHEDKISRLEQLQIKHHRRSRQSLYERVEKYLDKRGHHGHHCVLRTLCETGQKSEEEEPGTFVGELMRAVFTIPEALDNEPVAYRDTHYDKAHASKQDCASLYPECKQSMWQAQFIQ